ncbi:hypothetical protein ASV53_23410 [Photobacterium sanguinicancri]|uniref:DNA methylase N-4/N-6 domain-containing protein n=1 Tax=Photobacterium sanguinicancri TaxID=875932 RepID=A0ABX4FRN3_9GAMM|nr:hypothetical protein ASV53_23410 [Photobacterium sanguinicancri]
MVIEPFFGSGSTLVAASNLNCEYLGCDASPSTHAYSIERQSAV